MANVYQQIAEMFLQKQNPNAQLDQQNNTGSFADLLKAFAILKGRPPMQQPAIGSSGIYSTQGNLPFNQRTPIVHPGGVTEYNPMTQEERDLVKHPSVQWMKERDKNALDFFIPKTKTDSGQIGMDLLPEQVDPEFAYHAKIIGELAKRNPEVLYASGMLNDLVDRSKPGDFAGAKEEFMTNLSSRPNLSTFEFPK